MRFQKIVMGRHRRHGLVPAFGDPAEAGLDLIQVLEFVERIVADRPDPLAVHDRKPRSLAEILIGAVLVEKPPIPERLHALFADRKRGAA